MALWACSLCCQPLDNPKKSWLTLSPSLVLLQVRMLSDHGVREVTLLGQNVNSYADSSSIPSSSSSSTIFSSSTTSSSSSSNADDPFAVYAKGFSSVYKPRRQGAVGFAELLDRVAGIDPEMRIRFTSPHPKDFGDDVLQVRRGCRREGG